MRAVFSGICLSILTALSENSALAKSEVDRDTGDRHERASSQSSDDDDHGSSSCCYDSDYNSYSDPDPIDDTASPYSPGYPARPTSADLLFEPHVGLDRPGGGISLDLGFPYLEVDAARRTGLYWRFDLSYARWLDHYRPEGADYTSTMSLLRVSTALLYRYTWVSELAEVSLAVGPGFSMVRALESFDDGTPDLNETLSAALTLGPSLRAELKDGLFGGRVFVEGGIALSAGRVSPYLSQYDSLVHGIDVFMVKPRLSAGHFWAISSGVELGVSYELETIGGIDPRASLAHSAHFAIRLSSYVQD